MTNRRVPGRRGVVGLTLLVSLSIVGCGKDSPTGTPTPVATTLTLSATALSFSSLGASDQLTATVRDQNGATVDGASVAWASSASSVASVSSTGLVTAVADGTTTITATSGSATGTASVTVAAIDGANASISGALFIDEFSKDSILNTGLEENLTIANVPVRLEGLLVLDTMTVLTDATGSFTFPDLAEGSYHIMVESFALIPGMVAFSGMNPLTRTVGPGGHETANFAFSIITQTINVGAFLGTDLDISSKPGAGITPIKGWSLRLFDTEFNAAAHVATGSTTGSLTSKAVKTNSAGMSTFRFARTADLSPDSSKVDHLVFAASRGAPSGTYGPNGETIIEIQYATTDSSVTAVDEFDALYNALTVAFNAEEIDGDALPAWQTVLRANNDTLVGPIMSGATDAVGWSYFDLAVADLATTSDGALPDTLWMRLSTTQAAANGHGFTQSATDREGAATGGQVKFIWDGTNLPNDTIWVGTERVKYTDVDVLFGIHQEQDDSTDVATFTKGDGTTGVSVLRFQLYNVSSSGKATTFGGTFAPGSAGTPWKAWERPYFNIAVDTAIAGGRADVNYQIRARSTDPRVDVLNDTLIDFTLDGGDQIDTIAPLRGSGGVSTFATKANNTSISGTILSVDGVTPVSDMRLTIEAGFDNIQPNERGTDSTVVKTDAAGTFSMTGLREGPYTVTVDDSTGVWSYLTTLTTSAQKVNTADFTVPVAGTEKGGTVVGNTLPNTAERDNEGYASTSVVNFAPHRMDTKILGVLVNDRDFDNTTIDPNETLAGAVVELWRDDSLVGSTTTDASGAYSFENLQERQYVVSASDEFVVILRERDGFDPGGLPSTATVTTAATADNLGQDFTRQVGDTNPNPLPYWNYEMSLGDNLGPTNFTFLYKDGTASGFVEDQSGNPVSDVIVDAILCRESAGSTSPPTAGSCTSTFPGSEINTTTDATGRFGFNGLEEGVYQITVKPWTQGFATANPANMLFPLSDRGDVEAPVDPFILSGTGDIPSPWATADFSGFGNGAVAFGDVLETPLDWVVSAATAKSLAPKLLTFDDPPDYSGILLANISADGFATVTQGVLRQTGGELLFQLFGLPAMGTPFGLAFITVRISIAGSQDISTECPLELRALGASGELARLDLTSIPTNGIVFWDHGGGPAVFITTSIPDSCLNSYVDMTGMSINKLP